MPGTDKKYLII